MPRNRSEKEKPAQANWRRYLLSHHAVQMVASLENLDNRGACWLTLTDTQQATARAIGKIGRDRAAKKAYDATQPK